MPSDHRFTISTTEESAGTPEAGEADQIARFNRNCGRVAAIWLFVALPVSLYLRPTYQDFTAYYFAGTAVRTHHWDLLYPRRDPGSRYFIISGYEWKPGQLELAGAHGMKDMFPFFGLPWNALLFVPLSMLSYRASHAVWVGVLLLCTYAVARLAGGSYTASAGRASRAAGVITLITAMSLLSYRAVRVANVSPTVALALSAAVFALLRNDKRSDLTGTAALFIGGLLKYATVILLPLLLVTRRWRMIVWTCAAGVLTVALTLALVGTGPFVDFFQTVGASFGGSTPLVTNQSIWGFLLRITRAPQLPAALALAVRALEAATLVGILVLILRQRRDAWHNPSTLFAAAAALIAWLLIFSPVFWEHYATYLMPFWGWIAWEATATWKKLAAAGAIALAWLPLPAVAWLHLPEPLNSTLLWSCTLVLALALARLLATAPFHRNEMARSPAA